MVKNNIQKPVWMTGKIKKSIKKRYDLYKKSLNSNKSHEYQKYLLCRNQCNKMIRHAKKEYERRLSKESRSNPKYFGKYVQSKMKTNTGIGPLLRKDGQIAVSDADKVDVLNTIFSSVFTRKNTTNIPQTEVVEKSEGRTQTDVKVTLKAVHYKLNKLNSNKAQGANQAPATVLKELNEQLAMPLCILLNKSLESGLIPVDWTVADVTAIFEKGTKSDPGNYRPLV